MISLHIYYLKLSCNGIPGEASMAAVEIRHFEVPKNKWKLHEITSSVFQKTEIWKCSVCSSAFHIQSFAGKNKLLEVLLNTEPQKDYFKTHISNYTGKTNLLLKCTKQRKNSQGRTSRTGSCINYEVVKSSHYSKTRRVKATQVWVSSRKCVLRYAGT